MCFTRLNFTLKGGYDGNFMLCVFYHNKKLKLTNSPLPQQVHASPVRLHWDLMLQSGCQREGGWR